ncbi:unnamed protein product [Leptidea sinapis]|uniref:Uncharacterized protein n=1 Tax=Leptidea sinapis TaxID=189913 RepID=A0A5E4QWM7_9NEOP|nr:unnamed protein product [Leptidea sinapis]
MFPSAMKLEWTESESDYGLEEAAFYEAPALLAPPPRKHVSFSLRLDLRSFMLKLVNGTMKALGDL